MADSFRKEASDSLYEWMIESLTHSIHSKTDSFMQCCSETHKCVSLFGTIFTGETDKIVSKI